MTAAKVRVAYRAGAAVFLLVQASLAASFDEYPVKNVHDYPSVQTASGVFVAAVPVEDAKVQYDCFGFNLRAKGYLPVLVVVKNEATGDSYLFHKDRVTFAPVGQAASSLRSPGKSTKADKAVTAAGYVPTIYTMGASLASSRLQELRQHLIETELQSSTLSPGVSTHGFVFVPVRGGYSSRPQIKITIPFLKSGTNEVVNIDSLL